ncbi:unnamed protein product [Echinostoma caproni]|uniref:Erythroid differentiation-related factor 1 n=1 Tax=Echinostoma caproni TaxID=27848 RepID=A0A183B7Q2_9TREM|nr:unnamed protein product [Echinostoma caproni]
MDDKQRIFEEVEAGDAESMEKSILQLKSGQLNDIAALHEGFDLQRMPQNYLNKRSCIEKLIFHATMSDALKSPFSGVNQSPHVGLKLSSDQPFDVKTLHKSLPAPSPNDSGSEWDSEPTDGKNSRSQLTSSEDPLSKSIGYHSPLKGNSARSWTANPDEFLHTAKWQLQDLSFLVGSDLAIFGTPKHPCISLKLSPMHESINVLTGIDIWLENILNEVPEVAMCYHHEGIVMQEYELYKTCDVPAIAGFETKQIYRIVQNIIMFLKRNATQEGHTYWLVKEPECGLVKLYDLTTLCENDRFYGKQDRNTKESEEVSHQSEYQRDSLTDALRLVRNCLNVISLAERGVATSDIGGAESTSLPPALDNLKTRAIWLLCRLYLATPYNLLSSCIQLLQTDIKPGFGVSWNYGPRIFVAHRQKVMFMELNCVN